MKPKEPLAWKENTGLLASVSRNLTLTLLVCLYMVLHAGFSSREALAETIINKICATLTGKWLGASGCPGGDFKMHVTVCGVESDTFTVTPFGPNFPASVTLSLGG